MNVNLYNEFSKVLDTTNILVDEPMKKHTTFKIGGPADFFLTPQNKDELIEVLNICREKDIPFYIIGNGSNLLITDKGYRGAIIQIYKNFNKVTINDRIVEAESGVLLSKLSSIITESNLAGFEFASGIPGTLGGAVCMNAGAYGGEIKDVLLEATLISNAGEVFTLQKDELELGYRTSVVQQNKYIVLSVKLELQYGNKEEIQEKIDNLTVQRKTKQPLEYPSAGSTFKRPVGHFVGKLISDAGLRGYRVGGAQISEKHCGFVINVGEATANDVLQLINNIKKIIKEKYNVDLEPEVRVIGEQ